jgi:hypothetical protein
LTAIPPRPNPNEPLSLPAPVHRVRRNLVTVGEAEVVGVVAGQLGCTTLSPADPVLTERADRAFAVRPSSVAVAPCHDHRSHCHDAMWAFRPRRHTCLLHRRGRLAQQAPTLPAASASSRHRPKEGIRETDHGRARRWPPAWPYLLASPQTGHHRDQSTLRQRPRGPIPRRGSGGGVARAGSGHR